MSRPVVLIILDGWGLAPPGEGNAVAQASTPTMDAIWSRWPHTQLSASGRDVGLPAGQMGNSEVGHMNLGAGRVVRQYLVRIDDAIADGTFFRNQALAQAAEAARGGRLHLVGLCSEGGIHSSLRHLQALLAWAKREGLQDVCVHAITDGRDTPPSSAAGFLEQISGDMRQLGIGRLACVSGRYYAMDRDQRWERTEKAYRAMVTGEGPRAIDFREALAMAARRPMPGRDGDSAGGETDEFITPTVLVDRDGVPLGTIRAQDVVLTFNWRADRMRQIVAALTDPNLHAIARPFPAVRLLVGMAQYDEAWRVPFAFPPADLRMTVGEVVSGAGLRQLRIAETEKYAHVTYFFNGGVEAALQGEERILVPSPKVATYDLQPEMSAAAVARAGAHAIAAGEFGFVVINFANPDMVGHTGVPDAARRAVEAADRGLAEVLSAIADREGIALVLADHGNAECMIDSVTGAPHTAHTTNPVPCVLVGRDTPLRSGGRLADVGPTLLELLGLETPEVMDGRSLFHVAGGGSR